MTRLSRAASAVVALTALFGSAAAVAQENIVELGYAYFDIHSSAPDITGPLTPPGANLKVGNASTLGLTFTHLFDDHWGVSFLVGIPPKNDVQGEGTLSPAGQIATVKSISPTLLAQYYFMDKDARFRPYVGAGINYTRFSDAEASSSLAATLGGPTSISLQNSSGLALQLGSRFNIDKNWLIDFSVVKADVKSMQTTTTGPIQRTTTIDFNPLVFALNVGYRF